MKSNFVLLCSVLSSRLFPALALATLLLSVLAPATALAAEEGDTTDHSLRAAFNKGTWKLNFRPRFENVDEDRSQFAGKDAEAFTLRTSLSFQTKSWKGLTFGIEAEDIAAIGNELYNNAGAGSNNNGVRNRPVVADPDLTEINQVWLAYDFSGKAKLKAGRFEQNLGDQRFMGAVAWRQNHQSFDAVSLASNFGSDNDQWSLTYLYLDQIHTITGARQELAGHVFDLRYKAAPGSFGLSSQWLDYDAAALAGRSLATIAGNFTGKTAFDSVNWFYDLQYAQQEDHGDNPNDVSHSYYKIDTALGVTDWTFRIGTEVLEGDGTTAFSTPLATLHKFNGWADRFLATPVDGLEDLYFKIGWKKGSWSALAAYHDFSSENTSADWGSEIDAQLMYTTSWKQSFALKFADYDADAHSVDATKIMLFTTFGFGN